jgi:O-antigen/teichoic acid export membrane protein
MTEDGSRLGRLADRLPGGAFVRNVSLLISGSAAAQLVIAASAPVLSRVYDPDEIGAFAVFASLVALLAVVSSLSYEQAIALPDDERDGATVFALASLATAAVTVVVALATALFAADLFDALQVPELTDHRWWLPGALLFSGWFTAVTMWVVRTGNFRRLAFGRATQGIGLVAVQVGAGAAGAGLVGLVSGYLVSWLAGTVVMAASVGVAVRLTRGVTWARLRGLASRYRRFPLYGSPAALCNRTALELPAVALAALYGPAQAGFFLLAQRTIAAPVQLVGQAVGQVYLNQAAPLARSEPASVAALYRRIWHRLLLLGLVPCLVLLVAGPALYGLVFGDDWREAGEIARLLSLSFLAQLTVTPLTSTFAIAERQDLQFWRDLLRVAGVIGVFVLADRLSWSSEVTIGAYGVVMLLGYLALFWLGRAEVRRGAQGAWDARLDTAERV